MTESTTRDLRGDFRTMRRALWTLTLITGGLALLTFLYSGACPDLGCSETGASVFNFTMQMVLIVACCSVAFRLARAMPAALWTPVFAFPLGTALFFGFGSMSTFLGSPDTIAFLLSGNYGISSPELLRTNLLTFTGVTVTLATMTLAMRVRFGPYRPSRPSARLSLESTAVLFLVAGGALEYLLILPNDFGLTSFTVPGAFRALSPMVSIGFAVVAFLMVRSGRSWALLFWILWPPHVLLAVLQFAKTKAMIAFMLPAIGAFMAHRNWKRLAVWVLLGGLLFGTLQDFNTLGRLTIQSDTGTINDATFSDRFGIMQRAATGEISVESTATVSIAAAQTWWLRLNYAGAQLRAMELYDRGIRGEWTLSLAQLFIPRVLWPSKPHASPEGQVFNRIVSGNREARTLVGITVYANGYWQMGWAGVVLFSAIMGGIIGGFTRFSYARVTERRLIYLPVVFIVLQMSLVGPTGVLQKTILGTLPIIVAYILLISLFEQLLRPPNAPNATAGTPDRAE